MSWTTTINGVSYTAPDVGENFWGTQVKNWMQAVGGTGSGQGGMLKKDGGLFQLLSEVNFGTSFGIKSLTYTSGSANAGAAAGAGQIRLKRADTVQWRNNADSANLTLGVSTSNWIQWQSVDLADISSAQTFTNKTISGASNTLTNISLGSLVAPSAGTIYSDGASILSEARLSLSRMAVGTQYYVLMGNGASSPSYQLITNNSVDAAAAIARNKLASGSASHVVINDGSGVMSSEARLSLARTADGTANYVLIAAGLGSSPAYGLITNSSIDAAAAIARTKIAAGSANHVLINDGAGNLSSEAQLSVSRGGTGLSAVGTSNQVLGVNNAGNAYEFKTESVGTSGTDFAISHSAGSIVYNLPDASSVNRGALTSTDWSTFNSKIGGSGTNGQVALFSGTSTITSSSSIAYSTSANSNTLSLLSGIKIGMNTTLAASAGSGAIRYNSGVLEYSDGATWNTLGVSGAGILTLNSLNATAQTMVVGTSGTDFAISSASSTHTFNLPDAGASARGVVTTGTQTFAGAKTFSDAVTGTKIAKFTTDTMAASATEYGIVTTTTQTFAGVKTFSSAPIVTGLNIAATSFVLNSAATNSGSDWTATIQTPATGMTASPTHTLPAISGTLTSFDATNRNGIGLVPVGAIIPFFPGSFGGSGNTTYTNRVGAGNTVAQVNTLLNSVGWYVCDGTALNDAASPIFNGAGRFLPDLTDSRFIQGSTTAGAIGGANTYTPTGTNSAPTFTGNAVASGNNSVNTTTRTTSVALGAITQPTFTVDSHTHSGSSLAVEADGSNAGNQILLRAVSASFTATNQQVTTSAGSSSSARSNGIGVQGSTGTASANTTTRTTDVAIGALTQPTFTVDNHTHTTTATGSVSDPAFTGTATDQRPKYLNVYYIMRVK